MNDRFLIAKHIKEFIMSINDIAINFPRKEFVIKDRIMNDCLDILELVYNANYTKDDTSDKKIQILSKLSMLDFYFERSYKLKILSEKVCIKKCAELTNIRKMIYGWMRSDSKLC